MGCCQNRPCLQLQSENIETIIIQPKGRSLEPLRISIIGDSDGMDFMDDIRLHQTSILDIQSPPIIKFPSETVIIDLRSGSSLASPLKHRSSRNLNQKFLEML